MWEDLRQGHGHSRPAKCAPISLARMRAVEVLRGKVFFFFLSMLNVTSCSFASQYQDGERSRWKRRTRGREGGRDGGLMDTERKGGQRRRFPERKSRKSWRRREERMTHCACVCVCVFPLRSVSGQRSFPVIEATLDQFRLKQRPDLSMSAAGKGSGMASELITHTHTRTRKPLQSKL